MPGLLFGVYLPDEQFPLAPVARGLLGAVAGAVLGALSGLIGWFLGRTFRLPCSADIFLGSSLVGAMLAAAAEIFFGTFNGGVVLAIFFGLLVGLFLSITLYIIEWGSLTSVALTAGVLGLVIGSVAGTMVLPIFLVLFGAGPIFLIGMMGGIMIGSVHSATSVGQELPLVGAIRGALLGAVLGMIVAGLTLLIMEVFVNFHAWAAGGCLVGQMVGAILGGYVGRIIQALEREERTP
jgi:hypothetical protein